MTDSTTFRNPVAARSADPWVYKHADGFYYFMCTRGDRLELSRSARLSEIAKGDRTVIWVPEPGGA